jgi:hypothetical protein
MRQGFPNVPRAQQALRQLRLSGLGSLSFSKFLRFPEVGGLPGYQRGSFPIYRRL